MAATVLKSLLKEVIDALPEKTVLKGESVENVLKKRGVKPEELQFKGGDVLNPQKAYTKQDLIDWEASRTDIHSTIESPAYIGTSTHDLGQAYRSDVSNTYSSRITEVGKDLVDVETGLDQLYKTGQAPAATRGSGHFQRDKNYLYHTRGYDEDFADKSTRVILEVQSDTIQQARQKVRSDEVYFDKDLLNELVEKYENKTVIGIQSNLDQLNVEIQDVFGWGDSASHETERLVLETMDDIVEALSSDSLNSKAWVSDIVRDFDAVYNKGEMPNIPHSKAWMRKALEQEIVLAKQSGKQQIAVPIKDSYDITKSVLTDQQGDMLRLTEVNKLLPRRLTDQEYNALGNLFIQGDLDAMSRLLNEQIGSVIDKPIAIASRSVNRLARARGVQKWYEGTVDSTMKKLAKQSGSMYRTETKEGVEYAVIEFGEKTDTSKFKLYSAGGALLGSAGLGLDEEAQTMSISEEQIAAAREAGFSDEEIQASITSRAKPADDVNAKALAAGFTQEEIDLAQRQKQIRGTDFSKTKFAQPAEDVQRVSDVPPIPGESEFEQLGRKTIMDIANEIGVDPTTQEGINAIYSQEGRQYETQRIQEGDKQAEEFYRFKAEGDGLEGQAIEDYIAEQKQAASIARGKKGIEQAKNVVVDLNELTHIDRPWEWMQSKFGQRAAVEYEALKQNNINTVTAMGAERGLQLEYKEERWFATDKEGNQHVVEPGLLDSMGAAKYETIGALGGAIAGARIIKQVSASIPQGKLGKLVPLGIITAASTLGAVTGDQIDYLQAAMNAQEEWDSKLAAEKAMGTAEFSVIADVIAGGVLKTLGSSWKYIKHGYELVKDGNTSGAYQALKHALGDIDDVQINEIIKRWEDLNQMPAPGKSIQEQALAIAPTTQPGGEAIVAATTARNPTASSAVANEVNKRAQTLIDAARTAKGADAGRQILEGLDDYTSAIKTQYDVINREAEVAVRPSYKFDLPKLGVKPLLEHQIANVSNPAKVEQLVRILERVDNNTIGRSFPDLLDLYRTVNDFKYNGTLKRHADKEAVQETLATIKSEIKKQTEGTTKKGKIWYANWEKVNKDYTKFKSLEKNTLYKQLTKPGITEDEIASKLMARGPAVDDTYNEVIRALPPKQVKLVENSIVDKLAGKYTTGKEGEFKAVDFVSLDKALKAYNFKTPEADRLKQVTSRMAEVFKNDPKLAAAAGKIDLPGFQSYLTTNPWERVKYEIASKVFNKVKSLSPGKEANIISMVNKTAKLLEDPLNAKTTQQVIEMVKDDQELVAAINRFQREVAKANAEGKVTVGKTLFKKKSKYYDTEGLGRRAVNEVSHPHRTINGEDLMEQLGIKHRFTRNIVTAKVKRDLLDQGVNTIRLKDGELIFLDKR